MAGYADICRPYICTFFVARIPYQIILIICNAPHCKVYIIDPVIFPWFPVLPDKYFLSCWYLLPIQQFAHSLLPLLLLLHKTELRFPGHIGMNIILRIFDIRRHFNRHFIRTITLLFVSCHTRSLWFDLLHTGTRTSLIPDLQEMPLTVTSKLFFSASYVPTSRVACASETSKTLSDPKRSAFHLQFHIHEPDIFRLFYDSWSKPLHSMYLKMFFFLHTIPDHPDRFVHSTLQN